MWYLFQKIGKKAEAENAGQRPANPGVRELEYPRVCRNSQKRAIIPDDKGCGGGCCSATEHSREVDRAIV
jgi:hypothetical protein